LQAIVLDTIAEWVSKLKVTNSGANPVYIAFNEFPNVVGNSLSDLTGSGVVKIDAGDSNVFEIGANCRMFGLISITGTNSVKVIQGI
jgi:repressor of nif and glnA expression